nr:unnamed protein product [Callosobruchus analis]
MHLCFSSAHYDVSPSNASTTTAPELENLQNPSETRSATDNNSISTISLPRMKEGSTRASQHKKRSQGMVVQNLIVRGLPIGHTVAERRLLVRESLRQERLGLSVPPTKCNMVVDHELIICTGKLLELGRAVGQFDDSIETMSSAEFTLD